MLIGRSARFGVFFLLLAFAACSSVSKEYRQEAEPRIDFELLAAHPNEYVGRTVILGGYIVETEVTKDYSFVHVLQAPLDFSDLPGDRDRSLGRFVIQTAEYLDPEIYKKDRLVTAAGKVLGSREIEVGSRTIAVPVISGEEIILQPQYDRVRERYYYGPFGPYYYFDGYPFYYPPFRYW